MASLLLLTVAIGEPLPEEQDVLVADAVADLLEVTEGEGDEDVESLLLPVLEGLGDPEKEEAPL